MELELLDYNLVGGLKIEVIVRKRAVFAADPSLPVPLDDQGRPRVAVDENGVATKLVSPTGDTVRVELEKNKFSEQEWGTLVEKLEAVEKALHPLAVAAYEALLADPSAIDAALNAKQAEMAALDAELAAKRALVDSGT